MANVNPLEPDLMASPSQNSPGQNKTVPTEQTGPVVSPLFTILSELN